jgi:hypothetical protein
MIFNKFKLKNNQFHKFVDINKKQKLTLTTIQKKLKIIVHSFDFNLELDFDKSIYKHILL